MGSTLAVITVWDLPGRTPKEIPLALKPLAGLPLIEHGLVALGLAGINEIIVASSMTNSEIANLKKTYPKVRWVSGKGRDAAGGFKAASKLMKKGDTVLVFDGLCPGADAAFIKKIIKTMASLSLLAVACPHQCGDDHAAIARMSEAEYKKAFVKDGAAGLEDLLEDREDKKIETPHLEAPMMQDFAVRDIASLAEAAKIKNSLINHSHMEKGVVILDPENTWIDSQVVIGRGTQVLPYSFLTGATRIGRDCIVGPFARIENCKLEDQVHFEQSVASSSIIRSAVSVGPWSRLRPGCDIGKKSKLGNFCEFKNANLGMGVKAGHLSYLGDVSIGDETNIGAGTITANYDGKKKHKTHIGKGAFTGSNSVLVAPVTLGNGAKTGAGAVVLAGRNLPAGTVAVGNPARQLQKKGK